MGRRLYHLLWWKHVWIEARTEDSVTWRKHWIRLLARLWPPTLLILGLSAVLGLFLSLSQGGRWWYALLMGLLLAPAVFWWWWSWVDWSNDLYIVTDDRIIDVSKLPLGFRSTRTETTFDKIQNVSFDIHDPIATLLNYGTVFIHTAGAEGRLDFEYGRAPKRVQAEIFRRVRAYEEAQRRQRRDEQWADLPEWFAEYDRARRP